MKEFLKEDYLAWQDSFLALPERGIRVNGLKSDPAEFPGIWRSCGGETEPEPIGWIHNGFFIEDTAVFSGHPFYQAGLYYIQEPSAMTPAEILPVKEGDYVLDLCAAPGGKATELLAKLNGKGILYANDISASRAKILRKNLEMAGAANAFVTAESPGKLSESFPGFFDKILVDAPCSGEGMFRRKPEMVSDWIERGPEYYAPLQRDILEQAVTMLAPGGMMVYSTCTFSELENEENVMWLLGNHPEMEVCETPDYPGFMKSKIPGLNGCIRIMPHRMRGEGQFICLLAKRDAGNLSAGARAKAERETVTAQCTRLIDRNSRFEVFELGGQVYLLPEGHKQRSGIRYLMTGLHVGEYKSGKLRPTQALAQILRSDEWPVTLNLPVGDERLGRYLRGESILFDAGEVTRNREALYSILGVSLEEIIYTGISEDAKKNDAKACGRKTGKGNSGRKKQYTSYKKESLSGTKIRGTGKMAADTVSVPLYTDDILVLAGGYPVGFGSENRGLLKNRRNPGWRMQ